MPGFIKNMLGQRRTVRSEAADDGKAGFEQQRFYVHLWATVINSEDSEFISFPGEKPSNL